MHQNEDKPPSIKCGVCGGLFQHEKWCVHTAENPRLSDETFAALRGEISENDELRLSGMGVIWEEPVHLLDKKK